MGLQKWIIVFIAFGFYASTFAHADGCTLQPGKKYSQIDIDSWMENAIKNEDIPCIEKTWAIRVKYKLSTEVGFSSSPLHMAAYYGKNKSIESLLKLGSEVNYQPKEYNTNGFEDHTALMYAVKGGHLETVKLLLSVHADPNLRKTSYSLNDYENTPLHAVACAVEKDDSYLNRVEIAQELLNHGASRYPVDTPKKMYPIPPPILCAAKTKNLAVARLLVTTKEDANYRYEIESFNPQGFPEIDYPIVLAAKGENHAANLEFVKFLIEQGADPNVRSIDDRLHGATALHVAAESGQLDLVNYLISKNVSLNEVVKTFNNKRKNRETKFFTPLDSAMDTNQAAVIEALRNAGAKTREELLAIAPKSKTVSNLAKFEIKFDERGVMNVMTHAEGEKYCTDRGSRLPTVRELAMHSQSMGARGIREASHPGQSWASPDVFHEILQIYQDGFYSAILKENSEGRPTVDFYFESTGFANTDEEPRGLSFWSSSIFPDNPDIAYVFSAMTGNIEPAYRKDKPFHSARCVITP